MTIRCQKPQDIPASCAHYIKNHTANYKGCNVYETVLAKNTILEGKAYHILKDRSPTTLLEKFPKSKQNWLYASVLDNSAIPAIATSCMSSVSTDNKLFKFLSNLKKYCSSISVSSYCCFGSVQTQISLQNYIGY